MTRTETVMRLLLAAATELAEARRHDSDTCEEWDALERAITAAEESTEPSYAFEGERFVRRSTRSDGEERADSIDLDEIEIIAQTIEEDADPHGNGWFVADELVAPSGRTWTRCLVAIECLKRLGLLRERSIDNRLSMADGFGVEAAIAAFRRAAGLPAT
ncbi:MAG: hypothetical protein KF724_12460 [Phycisphaeraceae bacterium]|nr:hypothetical protein [Phycisphaeraceae bacterium]